MKKQLIITLLALFFSGYALANDDMFVKANQGYKTKDYGKALELYLNIAEDEVSSSLLYNIGNTYFRLGDYANSILHYERALRLEPRNKDINNNLRVAKARLKGDTYIMPEFVLKKFWNNISNLFLPSTWTIITIALFLVSFLFFILYRFSIDRKVAYFYIFIMSLILTLSSLSLGINRENRLNDRSYVIIINDNVVGKTSPDSNTGGNHVLYKGQKARIIEELDIWYRIRLEDGKELWSEKSNFAII